VKFASLGSGSKGNATIIDTENGCLMIDCGFSIKETTRRLERVGKSPQDISAILVTHEHSDHWKGVLPFSLQLRLSYLR
jgi:phosphoribosyl 1,2-cyclic phosphodiesterase